MKKDGLYCECCGLRLDSDEEKVFNEDGSQLVPLCFECLDYDETDEPYENEED